MLESQKCKLFDDVYKRVWFGNFLLEIYNNWWMMQTVEKPYDFKIKTIPSKKTIRIRIQNNCNKYSSCWYGNGMKWNESCLSINSIINNAADKKRKIPKLLLGGKKDSYHFWRWNSKINFKLIINLKITAICWRMKR